jgi:hypothetical protein
MMRRYSLTARRMVLTITATFVASLAVTVAGAQAVVVTDNGTKAGVALAPGAVLPHTVSPATGPNPCTDPWLSADLGGPTLPSSALCWGRGAVMHKNETFALTWDHQPRAYWSWTRGYVEQFLRDVADSSGSLASPFAVSTQYNDAGGRAQNASIFGGGCIDYGQTGGADCENGAPTAGGHNYPANDCTVSGDSFVTPTAVIENDVCLTDADLKSEVATMVNQTGILGRTQAGYTPLVTLLMPPMVKVCLDSADTGTGTPKGQLCSVNGNLTPPSPAVSSADTGSGRIPAGSYKVLVAYTMTAGGTSAPSASQPVTTTSSNTQDSSITISSPPGVAGVSGWNVYVTQNNGLTYTLQQTAGIGTAITLDTLTTTGRAAPVDTGFCSYHSKVSVGGTQVAYVVQPWTAGTQCDEPDAPPIPQTPTTYQMAIGVGQRLVSPLSQAELAAITNPGLNGWLGEDATEINDNRGCVPVGNQLDKVTLGNSSQNPYYLQRESNNAGVLAFDPATYFGCAPQVDLDPAFVVPSAVDQGDVIQFDGSATASTLIVPRAGYAWDFGDGAKATGPSVVHSFAKGGVYNVKLTVTDRGGNVGTLTQTIQVLGSPGQPAAPGSPNNPGSSNPVTPGSSSGPGSHTGGSSSGSAVDVHLQLMPQSLKSVLRHGISVRVSSNKDANGIATVSISRAAARRAHIKVGSGQAVRIGIGTLASVTNGTVTLHLHLSPAMARKLAHLGHVTMSIRLALVAAGNQSFAVDAAGRY